MFKLFERFLTPTAVPENPEPPAGLIAFLWHFARQAKPLFIALFVVEFFVALTDAAVPWFMGRIVTMVSEIPPDRFLQETWPWLVGMALVVREGHETPGEGEIRELIRARLRSSRVPEKIVYLDELPYNEMGKLLRRKVKEILAG